LEPGQHSQQAKTDAEEESYKAIDRHIDSGNVVIRRCQLVDQPIQALPGVAYSVYENGSVNFRATMAGQ
jgi:hypothetical protein